MEIFDVGTATQYMVRFYEGGDVRMTISGSDVGIGTSSPDLRLTVQGSSGNIANFTNGSEDFVIYQDNSNSQIIH